MDVFRAQDPKRIALEIEQELCALISSIDQHR